MINKLINNKIVWIVLGSVLVILTIIVIIPKKDNTLVDEVYIDEETKEKYQEEIEEKIIFELKGDKEINLYVNDDYKEPGFVAILNDETDLSDNVVVESKLDNTKVGLYKITYTLEYKGTTKELERSVNVIDISSDDINLTLNGEEVIYLNLGEKYEELGAKATFENRDLTSEIEIINNINVNKIGEYEVIYKIKNTEISRKVIVFNINDLFKVDESNLLIKVSSNDNFPYIKLPNGIINKNTNISYKIPGNGNYEFILYTKELKQYKKIVTVKINEKEQNNNNQVPVINQNPPTGTCEAILKDGKTTVTVKSNSDIAKYIYNGVEHASSVFKVDKYLRESTVELIGTNNKKTTIKCDVKMESMDVIKTGSGETNKYKYESDTLKVYINYKKGFWITRLWVKDPVNQLNKQYTTKKKLQVGKDILTSAIGKNYTDKIVVGFNASMPIDGKNYGSSEVSRYPDLNYREKSALIIQNGKVLVKEVRYGMHDDAMYIAYIDSSNQLKYVNGIKSMTQDARLMLYQSIIDSGARNTIAWSGVMVENYKTRKLTKDETGDSDYKAYRQGLCQVDTNNFILITTKSSDGKMNRQKFANFVGTLGCRLALNFDGGGSIITMYKPKGTDTIKILTYGNENRKLSSVMYFTELS